MIDSDAITATIDRTAHVVLVVDDNAATRYSTTRILQVAGFRTEEAASGAEVLARAQSGIAAVVLDVHLPDISGFDVCRQLRASPITAAMPIVHLSAEFTRNEDRVAGLNAGADGYLVHPVEPAVLVATLQALIRARTAEDRLRLSELRFRAIYDHAPTGIVLLDPEGRVVDANPAMLQLLGLPKADLLGRSVPDLAAPASREVAIERTTGPGGRPWQGQFALVHADGSLVHLDWSISSHVEPGLRIAIASDATEHVQLEEQRREVLEREQAARAAAERHSRTKDDFIAVLSHELRTPLNAIVGWVAVLMRRSPVPETLKGLQAIDRNAKAQARIISDILDVSRINSGKLQLERELADPAAVVEEAMASLQALAGERKLQVQLALDGAREPAWLDVARFQQIFWNLATNAIKFSHEGGQILVSLAREGPLLTLRVQDFGQGIRADFLGRLFDRFSQSDAPGQRVHGGLGLGLSIVRQLAELHGGTVHAHSAGPGHGTVLQVVLDVESPGTVEAAPSQPGELPSDDLPRGRLPLEGMNILLVEDDLDANEMLAVILSDRGARVRSARDYDTAMAALRQSWPDVLVSDIGLPVRDGYELVRDMRRLQPPAGAGRLCALALTAFARPEDRSRAIEAGFDEHLAKPLNAHALVTAIQSLHGRTPASQH